jgi:N-acetylglucosaminyldiphosphoundecaprenol N-acetyl-beta-D-mannosaminyltransferase
MICTPNADHVIKARRDREFRRIINSADLAIPDGMGIVYASAALGRPLQGNVGGRLLLPHVCQLAADRGWSVFLLGGQPGSAELAAKSLQESYPGLRVAGTFCPGQGFTLESEEDRRAIAAIERCRPDIVFVALGAPKQEKWIAARKDICDIPLSMGVGYAFDVVGGVIASPPAWMTRVGLEWLYRLTKEPGRLWRRYLVDGALFCLLVLQARFQGFRLARASSS